MSSAFSESSMGHLGEHELEIRARRGERLAALGTMTAGIAHGLRNPLNAAHLQLEVAQRRLADATDPQVQRARVAIALAQTEIQRLSGLVDDFLEFARPQPLRLSLVDLCSTAAEIVASMTSEAAAAGVVLLLDEPAEPVSLELDEERMKQALLHLVRNAIDASPRGGRVHVQLRVVGSSACLRVQDSGAGMPAGAPVFEPFFTTKEHGAGLGLALVHRIVLDHAGSVAIESAPGRTLFSVTLPMTVPEVGASSATGHR